MSVAALARAEGRAAEPPIERPNIVFLFSDQQRWDSVECYGRPILPGLTPNLDRMAAEGVRFDNAFTPQPVCGPARACIQTGRYATEIGCWRNGLRIPEGERTFAHHLGEAGYELGYVGKWHLASDPDNELWTQPTPLDRRGGWDGYWVASDVLEFTSHSYDGHMFDRDGNRVDFPAGRYRADCLADYAVDFLRQQSRETPFCLMVSWIEPHHQNDHGHFEGPRGSKRRFGDYRAPGDLPPGKGDWEAEMPDYLGCIGSLDSAVGRIRRELDALNLARDTVVVYATDHGCHFHTREGEYKRSCHDACLRIPLMAVGPGFSSGVTVGRMVDLLDLPPTFLRAAGVTPPATMRGRPLQEALGPGARWRGDVFAQISESQTGRALRTPRWTYSVRAPEGSAREGASSRYREEFLYDNPRDPHQRTNLVREPGLAATRASLARRLLTRMRGAGEEPATIEPA